MLQFPPKTSQNNTSFDSDLCKTLSISFQLDNISFAFFVQIAESGKIDASVVSSNFTNAHLTKTQDIEKIRQQVYKGMKKKNKVL